VWRDSPLFLQDDVALDATPEGPALSRHGSAVVHRLELGEALTLALFGQFGNCG